MLLQAERERQQSILERARIQAIRDAARVQAEDLAKRGMVDRFYRNQQERLNSGMESRSREVESCHRLHHQEEMNRREQERRDDEVKRIAEEQKRRRENSWETFGEGCQRWNGWPFVFEGLNGVPTGSTTPAPMMAQAQTTAATTSATNEKTEENKTYTESRDDQENDIEDLLKKLFGSFLRPESENVGNKDEEEAIPDPEEPIIAPNTATEKETSNQDTTPPSSATNEREIEDNNESNAIVSFLNQLVPNLGDTLSQSGVLGNTSSSSSPSSSNQRTDNIANIIDSVIPGFGFGDAFKEANKALNKKEERSESTEKNVRFTKEEKGKGIDRQESIKESNPIPAQQEQVNPCAFRGPGFTIRFVRPDDTTEEKVEKGVEIKSTSTPTEAKPSVSSTNTDTSTSTSTSTSATRTATPVEASRIAADVAAAAAANDNTDAAANLIQAKYRQHLLRVRRLEKLDNLKAKLEKVTSAFEFPQSLDFASPSSTPSSPSLDPVDGAASDDNNILRSIPPLAFTPANHSYHAHAHALLALLTQADAIQSDGDKDIRKARKDFVKLVESKLAEMEIKRSLVWRERQSAEESVEVPDIETAAPLADAPAAPAQQDTRVEGFEVPDEPKEERTADPEPNHPAANSLSPDDELKEDAPESKPTSRVPSPTVEDDDSDAQSTVSMSNHSASDAEEEKAETIKPDGTEKVDEFVLL